MAQRFSAWFNANAYPWESYEESRKRYEQQFGPIKEKKKEKSPDDGDRLRKIIAKKNNRNKPTEQKVEETSGFLDSLKDFNNMMPWDDTFQGFIKGAIPGTDDAMASLGLVAGDTVAPTLEDLGLNSLGETVREWGYDTYRTNKAEAAEEEKLHPRPKTTEEELREADPNYRARTKSEIREAGDSFEASLYETFPSLEEAEWIPSSEEFRRDLPSSYDVGRTLTASGMPMVAAAGTAAVGIATGNPVIGGVGAMVVGSLGGAGLVSAEYSEQVRENPVVRRSLGIDPDKPFDKLSPANQQKLLRVASDAGRLTFGRRLTSSGLPEMLSYAPWGGRIFRAFLDVAGGTTSEMLDIDVGERAIVDALVKHGVPQEKAHALQQSLREIGPERKKVFTQTLVSEGIISTGFTSLESATYGAASEHVDENATSAKRQREVKQKFEEELQKIRRKKAENTEEIIKNAGVTVEHIEAMMDANDVEGATALFEHVKKAEPRMQNDVAELLMQKNPTVLWRIGKHLGDTETMDKAMEAQEELLANLEAEQTKADEAQEAAEIDKQKKKEDARAQRRADAEKADAAKKKKKTTVKKKKKKVVKPKVVVEPEVVVEEDVKPKDETPKVKPAKNIAELAKRWEDARLKGESYKFSPEESEMMGDRKEFDQELKKYKNTPKYIKENIPRLAEKVAKNPNAMNDFTGGELSFIENNQKLFDEELAKIKKSKKTTTKPPKKTTKATTKVEDTTTTPPETKAPKKTKEPDFTKIDDLSDEDVDTVIDIVGEERIPVRSVFTEDVPGRLSVLDETYPDGMTAEEMVMEEMSIQEEKNRIKNEPINEKIQIENEKRLEEGKDEKPYKSDDLSDPQLTSAQNRGEKNFAKAVKKIQAEQLAAKEKPKIKDVDVEKFNTFVDKFIEDKIKGFERVRKKGQKKQKATKKMVKAWEAEAIAAFQAEQKPVKKSAVRSRSASTRPPKRGAFGLAVDEVKSLVSSFVGMNKKLKKYGVKYNVISNRNKKDIQALTALEEAYFDQQDGKGEFAPENKEAWVKDRVTDTLENAEGFIDDKTGEITIITENISGDSATVATERLAEVLFHETIGHHGLKKTLGDGLQLFLSRFRKTEAKKVRKYFTEGEGQSYLIPKLKGLKTVKERQKVWDDLSDKEKNDLTEEFIVKKFAEFGARDPDVISRMGVHIQRALNKYGWGAVGRKQVMMTLKEIEGDYIGGDRNFWTGETFKSVAFKRAHILTGEEAEIEKVGLTPEEEYRANERKLREGRKREAKVSTEPRLVEGRTDEQLQEEYKIRNELYDQYINGQVATHNESQDSFSLHAYVLGRLKNNRKVRGTKAKKPLMKNVAQSVANRIQDKLEDRAKWKKGKKFEAVFKRAVEIETLANSKGVKAKATPKATPEPTKKARKKTAKPTGTIGSTLGIQEQVGFAGTKETFLGIMDSGATRSSIDKALAKKLKLKKSGKKSTHGSAFGIEKRDNVIATISLGGQTFEVEMSVSNRSGFDEGILIGRDVLRKGNFLVNANLESHLGTLKKSRKMGLYAKYNKEYKTEGSMLLHNNTRPEEGPYRITFFKADGELDMARTENGIGHEHFTTLRKAKDRLKEVGEDIQDISGGREVKMSRKVAQPTRELPITREHEAAITDVGLKFSRRTKPPPEKTFKAYKLLKMKVRKPGQVFPLFIGRAKPVIMGEWLDAEFIPTKGFSPRPGWHLSDTPAALHIGTEKKPVDGKQKPTIRRDDEVWAEVEVADDVDWQPEANRRGRVYSKGHKLAGQPMPSSREIKDEIPVDGNYRYKTNPNMQGEWVIAGAVKINRILSDTEVSAINEKAGIKDLPRRKPLDTKTYGFKQSRKAPKVDFDEKYQTEEGWDTVPPEVRQQYEDGLISEEEAMSQTRIFPDIRLDERRHRLAERFFEVQGLEEIFPDVPSDIRVDTYEVIDDRSVAVYTEAHPSRGTRKGTGDQFGYRVPKISKKTFKNPTLGELVEWEGDKGIKQSRKMTTFTEELAQAEAKIDPVAFAKAAEKRVEEGKKVGARRKSQAESIGAAYRLSISDEGVQKYLENKSDEGHGAVIGAVKLSRKMMKTFDLSKKELAEMDGQNAVGGVADRLALGPYTPLHGKNSTHQKIMEELHGGPDYAFQKRNQPSKEKRGVWASTKGAIQRLVNAIGRTEAKYGLIIVGKSDQHKSNMDVWNVMWGETLDARDHGLILDDGSLKRDADGNILKADMNWINRVITEGKFKKNGEKQFGSLLERQVKITKIDPVTEEKSTIIMDVIPKDLKSKITDFDSLMRQGENLTFDQRAEVLSYIFGNSDPVYAKSDANEKLGRTGQSNPDYKAKVEIEANGVSLARVIRRTSAYPDAKMGDLVGIVRFDTHKENMLTNADELGIKEHPTYDTVIQGQGIIRYEKGIPMAEWARDWLFQERENKQVPFFSREGQIDFERGFIYSPEMLAFLRGERKTEPKIKTKGFTAKQKLSSAKRVIEYKPDAGLKITTRMLTEPQKIDSNAKKLSRKMIKKSADFSHSRMGDPAIFEWQDKLAHKLTRRLVSQGTLNDVEMYKELRRRNKGTIMLAEQAGERLFKVLSKSDDQKALYEYFTTFNADPTKIKNELERKEAVKAKEKINAIGKALVKRGLMTQESLDKYGDQYLPRKYMKYLLSESDYAKISTGGADVKLDLSYLKKRLDIPQGIRELILGEVKDPAFLSSVAITAPLRDMAMLDWLEQIAIVGTKEGRDWVLPETLVQFDTLGMMKQLAGGNTELIKQLQLYDTEGVNVSGHWLLNEADRLQDLIDNRLVLTPDKEALVKGLIKKMRASGQKIAGVVLPKNYVKVPKGRKYGMLSGMAVRKEIFQDIWGSPSQGSFDVDDNGYISQSWAEKVLGTGGAFERYNRLWKWSKVSANPPSWVRNFVSNMIFMTLGPIPIHSLPGLFKDAIIDQISTRNRQRKGEAPDPNSMTALADKMGLTSGGFSQVELKMIRNSFAESKVKGDGVLGILNIRNAFIGFEKYVQRPTSDLYGGIDTLGKVMMLTHLKRKGFSDDRAAMEAEKWLFDYSNPLPSVKYLRKSAFGAPFLSYPSFVAPLMIETIIKRPWKLAPYFIFGELMTALFKEQQDIDDEEWQATLETLPPYLKNKAVGGSITDKLFPKSVIPLVWPTSWGGSLDKLGRAQPVDVGYLQPWGMFAEVMRELDPTKKGGWSPADATHSVGLLGAPILNIATTMLTNRDPFSDREIFDEFATQGEKAAAWFHYMWNLTMPPMMHGLTAGPGQGFGAIRRLIDAYDDTVVTKDGEPKFTEGQAIARMFGMNVTPIAPWEARQKIAYFEYQKIQRLTRKIAHDYRIGLQNGLSKKELEEVTKINVDKANALIKDLKEMLAKPLPKSLKRSKLQKLKAREKFLKRVKQLKAG